MIQSSVLKARPKSRLSPSMMLRSLLRSCMVESRGSVAMFASRLGSHWAEARAQVAENVTRENVQCRVDQYVDAIVAGPGWCLDQQRGRAGGKLVIILLWPGKARAIIFFCWIR